MHAELDLDLVRSAASSEIADSLTGDERENTIHASGILQAMVKDPRLVTDLNHQIGNNIDYGTGIVHIEKLTPELLMLAYSYARYLNSILYPKDS